MSQSSSELEALLKRTQRTQGTETWTEASPEPSASLVSLLNRMEAREWKNETLELAVEYIRELAYEIKLIQHLRKCGNCQLEVQLGIERYGGRNLPWFLDLINDVNECYGDPEYGVGLLYKDCPNVQDYKIGSYWSGASKDTLRFVNDRITWAEKIIRTQIAEACRFYKRLREWNLDGIRPTTSDCIPLFLG